MTTPILFLPGMMCDARLFAPQIAAFGAHRPVCVADLSRSDTMAGLACDALAQCRFPRFYACGLSMGGIVAMEMVRQAPERFAGLILLDTNHRAELPARRAARAGQIERAGQGGLRDLLVEEMKPNYLARAHREDAALLDLVLDMGLSLGPDVFTRQSLALRDRADSTQTLSRFSGPALIACGAEDALCPVATHQAMAALMPASRLVVFEDCGHLSTLENPTAVNEAIADWLTMSRY